MTLEEFLAKVRPERPAYGHGHVLGSGASLEALASWKTRWPHHPLPSDLMTLVSHVNGIHLWADLETGHAYQGLAPLEEWDLARVKMWGPDADPKDLDDGYLALSYHTDGAAFVVLNVDSGEYFLMDSCGVDESAPIGRSASELLDWLWENRLPPPGEDGSNAPS